MIENILIALAGIVVMGTLFLLFILTIEAAVYIRLNFRLPRIFQRMLSKQRTISSIRHELDFWGCDTRHLTDEEIEQRVTQIAHAFASAGVTVQNATAALARMSHLVKERIEI